MHVGFAPLCPPLHAEILLCMGAATKKPYVDEATNEIKIGTFIDITATLDHRYGDAAVFLPLYKTLFALGNDPDYDVSKLPENPHWSEKKTA